MPGLTYTSFTEPPVEWCAEALTAPCLVPGGSQADITQFGFSDAQTITVAGGVGTAAGAAITVTLASGLTAAIRKGQVLDFGAGKTLTLTERAEQGATSLVGSLASALVGGETFAYSGLSGRTVVASGALVGRSYAERTASANFGPWEVTDDEIFIVAFPNDDLESDAGITLTRHRHHVYENKLPGWGGMNAAQQAKVRELYDCLILPENN